MKIVYASTMYLKNGGGPIHRLLQVLPRMGRMAEIHAVSLGEADETCQKMLEDCCKSWIVVPLKSQGWHLLNKVNIAQRTAEYALSVKADIVILGWEFWDVLTALTDELKDSKIPVAVVIHSLPFLDAVPAPTGQFYNDLVDRIKSEPIKDTASYIIENAHTVFDILPRINIITLGQTMDFYINKYFPGLSVFTAHPGYALDFATIKTSEQPGKDFDFVLMSRLQKCKGLFELPYIFSEIEKTSGPKSLLLIGDFFSEEERIEFYNLISQLNVQSHIELAGFLFGIDKFNTLKRAKVCLYPSLYSDTFSISLMEALACSISAVAYDVPFTQCIYTTNSVTKVALNNHFEFAKAALHHLNNYQELGDSGASFARNFDSWDKVANAELKSIKQIIDGQRSGRDNG